MTYNTFEDWWYSMEGYHLLCERAVDEVLETSCELDPKKVERLRSWLKAAFEAAREGS